jgi:hypothetical protein
MATKNSSRTDKHKRRGPTSTLYLEGVAIGILQIGDHADAPAEGRALRGLRRELNRLGYTIDRFGGLRKQRWSLTHTRSRRRLHRSPVVRPSRQWHNKPAAIICRNLLRKLHSQKRIDVEQWLLELPQTEDRGV